MTYLVRGSAMGSGIMGKTEGAFTNDQCITFGGERIDVEDRETSGIVRMSDLGGQKNARSANLKLEICLAMRVQLSCGRETEGRRVLQILDQKSVTW